MKVGNLSDRYGLSFEELFLRTDSSRLKSQLKVINSEVSTKTEYINNSKTKSPYTLSIKVLITSSTNTLTSITRYS